jgi:uncharacterized protein YecT (DUF1311 family)
MSKEEEIEQAKAEERKKTRAAKEDNRALARLNRTYKAAARRAQEEPNITQLAITGTCVMGGVAGGIAGHRYLRKTTQTWIKKDNAGAPVLKDGKQQRTGGAVMVCEVLPITVGLGVGVATAFSKSGVVASVGGLGWGLAGGVVLDLIFPGPPPPPPEAKP